MYTYTYMQNELPIVLENFRRRQRVDNLLLMGFVSTHIYILTYIYTYVHFLRMHYECEHACMYACMYVCMYVGK